MERIIVLVFAGRHPRTLLRLPQTVNEGLPLWRLPQAIVQPEETARQAAARFAREQLGALVAPDDFKVIKMLSGETVLMSSGPTPFRGQVGYIAAEHRQGWRYVEEVLSDAWCNPRHWEPRLPTLMFEVRELLAGSEHVS